MQWQFHLNCFLIISLSNQITGDMINLDIVSPGVLGNYTASSITLSGPAFDVSIAKLIGLFPQFSIRHTYLYDVGIPDCATFQNRVQNMLAKWYYTERRPGSLVFVVTPGCIESAQINQLAAEWNVFFISSANSAPDIRDNQKSPTWITTNLFPSSYYGEVFRSLVERNNWTSVEILLDQSSTGFYTQASRMTKSALLDRGIDAVYTIYSAAAGSFDFPSFLKTFALRNRVLLFFGSPLQLRILLEMTYVMNMTTEDYVYVTARSFNWKPYGSYEWKTGSTLDETIRLAYSSLLRVTMVDLPMSMANLSLTAAKEAWNARYMENAFYQNSHLDTDPPIPMLTSLTAGLEIFGQVLRETLIDTVNSQSDLYDGTAMARKVYNRTFYTSVGDIYIDRFGERKPFLVTTAYFDQETSKFKAYLRSAGYEGFAWRCVVPLKWYNGSGSAANSATCGGPPLPGSVPKCGFDGSSCDTTNYLSYWVLLTCLIVLVNIGVTLHIFRNRRIIGLDDRWWRLDEALELISQEKLFSTYYF